MSERIPRYVDPYITSIINDYVRIHGVKDTSLEKEIRLGISRDIQARLLPPNVRVPSRKSVLRYIGTIYRHTGSVHQAIKSWLRPGSWTSSGGSFKLASDIGLDFAEILEDVRTEVGSANFLEIGAAFGGFHGADRSNRGSIKSLYDTLRARRHRNITFHFTNLTRWHQQLPDGVFEHPGIVGSTVSSLSEYCNEFDVVYSQCAVYFDPNVVSFIRQIGRLIRASTSGGLVVFNAKTTDVDRICLAAKEAQLELVRHKDIGGMNGTILVFRKN